jgi:hypothetical protein
VAARSRWRLDSQRGDGPAELRECCGQARSGRDGDALGSGRGPLGRLFIAADGGDERVDGVGGRRPVRLAELCRQSPGFFRGGDGY